MLLSARMGSARFGRSVAWLWVAWPGVREVPGAYRVAWHFRGSAVPASIDSQHDGNDLATGEMGQIGLEFFGPNAETFGTQTGKKSQRPSL